MQGLQKGTKFETWSKICPKNISTKILLLPRKSQISESPSLREDWHSQLLLWSSARPQYSGPLYLLNIQCVRKSPQLRTWSSWGPNCWNGPHLVLILHKRPHSPQSWYILGLESVFLYHKWRNIEISTSILLYMHLVGDGISKFSAYT